MPPDRTNSAGLEHSLMYKFYLFIAIVAEVTATSALKASESFTKLVPSVIVIVGYAATLFFFSLSLERINVGTAYAIWAGLGIVFVAIAGFVLYRQTLDSAAIAGIALILAGVLVLNLFSKNVVH